VTIIAQNTVKAFNFEPHGNFGNIFARFVSFLDECCIKHELNKLCKSKVVAVCTSIFYGFNQDPLLRPVLFVVLIVV
jgi:hypothetical protein